MDEELQKILEENLQLTKEIHVMVAAIRRHLFWQKVMSGIYLCILIAPIILAIIYLPPLLKPYLDQYNQLLNDVSAARSVQDKGVLDIQKYLEQR